MPVIRVDREVFEITLLLKSKLEIATSRVVSFNEVLRFYLSLKGELVCHS